MSSDAVLEGVSIAVLEVASDERCLLGLEVRLSIVALKLQSRHEVGVSMDWKHLVSYLMVA